MSVPSAEIPSPAHETSARAAAHSHGHVGATRPPSDVDSAVLLKGQKAVTIVHNGMPYRLQATKLGKLILTK